MKADLFFALGLATSAAAALTPTIATARTDRLASKRHLAKRQSDDGNYNITIFHINDVHAHLDEYSSGGSVSNPAIVDILHLRSSRTVMNPLRDAMAVMPE